MVFDSAFFIGTGLACLAVVVGAALGIGLAYYILKDTP